MKLLFIILSFVTVSLIQTCPIENGWKGIRVFQTSRIEVEKILGKPVEKRVYERYETDDAFVDIAYSISPCSNDGDGRFNVPKDVIIEYSIVLKKGIELSNFKWKKDLYKRYEDPHLRNLTHYGNPKDGINFTTNTNDGTEKVSIIYFERTKETVSKYTCKKE